MASTTMSATSYLNYLNGYISIILNYTDRRLVEHLNESYFDEIENHARFILAEWHSEQIVDKSSSLYIENVGYLNRKIALLTHTYRLNEKQVERIENLLFNSETIQLITSIIHSILETNLRHKDNFLRYLSILIDAFSFIKSSKPIFDQITKQTIQSKYYKQYLTETISSNIQPIHLLFIGAIGQLASPIHNSTLNELYSQFITTYYNQKHTPNDIDLNYCTLGILSQLEISSLSTNYSCLSALVSIFINTSTTSVKENTKIFLLPLLNLFNSLCIQSKTIACYLNTNQFIDILLQYVTNQNDYQIHIHTCLLLGHIISDKQLDQLQISYKLTMKLMDLLYYSKQEITDILHSLLSLTIHEQIQLIIADTYQLKHFIQLSEQYPIIYDIIWKLSFHSDILEQLIIRHEHFLKQLSTLSTIPAACGILHNIQMKNLSRLPTTNETLYDISLVASSKDRHVVQQMEEKLANNGLRVDTTLNSLCILLCVSEESKHDCTCQSAIRQALLECKKIILCIVQKPYRIDDWFSRLNIREKKPLNIVELGVEKIIPEIRKDLHQNHHVPAIIKRTRIVTPSHQSFDTTFTLSPPPSVPVVESPVVPKRKIQSWTNREVLEWCENNKLSVFTKILTLYDGRSLLALAHVSRMSAPHTIVNQLRNDCRKQGLKLSFVEFVRFQTALDELLRLERNLARKQSITTLANQYVYKGKTKNQT
jgi:hypothetical protein